MSANDWFAQTLADIVGLTVERPAVTETTAWGAAVLAGLGVGAFSEPADAPRRPGRRFSPRGDPALARARWADAVARTLTRPASTGEGSANDRRRRNAGYRMAPVSRNRWNLSHPTRTGTSSPGWTLGCSEIRIVTGSAENSV